MKFLTRLLIFTSFIFYSCNETSEVGIDELLINQKEITLVRDATHLGMKLKQDQDLE